MSRDHLDPYVNIQNYQNTNEIEIYTEYTNK